MRISDWSSDVCSSDLPEPHRQRQRRDLRSDAAKGGEFRHRAGNAAVVRVDDLPRDAPQVARLRFGEGGAMEQIGEGRLVQGGELRSEEHTSELQSLMRISYAVFCLKKKTKHIKQE